MINHKIRNVIFVSCFFSMVVTAQASLPIEENFSNDAANWFNAGGGAPATYNPTGGSDGGGFISQTLDLSTTMDADTPVLFRAQDEFGSSGNAFVGNYLTNGATELTVFIRHNAPAPLNIFNRFSGPGNFPGAVSVDFVPVFPNVWTQVSFPIDPSSPQFVSFEGSDFNSVFSLVGHLQIGPSITAGVAGLPALVQFDLDQVRLVPEPATAALFMATGIALVRRRR